MAKYTEAFCVTTGSMISIMQMRKIIGPKKLAFIMAKCFARLLT